MKSGILAATLLLTPLPALAAVDMFLDIKGIEGESRDEAHEGEIDVLAWSWGVATNARSGACVQDISITKYIDGSSADLMMAPITGETFEDATLVVRKAGAVPLDYLKITFKGVSVTSVSTGGSGGEDRLTENVTLGFDSAVYQYTPVTDSGAVGVPQTADIIPSRHCQ